MLRRAFFRGVVLAFFLAGCGSVSTGASDEGRLGGGTRRSAAELSSLSPPGGPLPGPPEEYGLPALADTENGNGMVTADAITDLFSRARTRPWAVTWLMSSFDGVDAGTVTMSHLSPAGGKTEQLHITGEVGLEEIGIIDLHLLDAGEGSRFCFKTDENPYNCGVGDAQLLLEFLSIEGMDRLGEILADLVSRTSVEIKYRFFAETPSICFNLAPAVMTGETLGLDFSLGGSFCLSNDGALMLVDVGEVAMRAVAYDISVDPGVFRLPV